MTMRKSIVFLLVSALAALVFTQKASAQYYPEYLSVSKGQLVDQNGAVLSDTEVLDAIGADIYNETYSGARKQYKAGGPLIIAGAVATGVGLIGTIGSAAVLSYKYQSNLPVYINNIRKDPKSINDIPNNKWFIAGMMGLYAGSVLAAAGDVALMVGIPLRVIGAKRLNWIADNYNGNAAPQAYVRLGAGQYGTGLIIDF